MEFQDRQLVCLDCQQPFTFTAGEQEFYQRKAFKEVPKRCKPCREQRKTRGPGEQPRAGGGAGAAAAAGRDDYGNSRAPARRAVEAVGNGYGSGGDEVDDDIGNRLPAGGGDARGNSAGVGGGAAGGGYAGPRGPRQVREVREVREAASAGRAREMFEGVCAQCGTATRVPFRPVAGRAVYCRDCYGARG